MRYLDPVEVQGYLEQRFHNYNASKIFAWAWNTGENVILDGPGGYGKSAGAKAFGGFLFEKGYIKTRPYVLNFGQGTTQEIILGGLDVKKFQDEGSIEYLLRNAFIQHEMVIFEEIWDAIPAVLCILKDILESGEVRNGNQVEKIKTKIVVACTNKAREDVITDDSIAALFQRFAMSATVVWSEWRKEDYLGAFQKEGFDGDAAHFVATLCGICSKKYRNVSDKIPPRIALKALKSYVVNGSESLGAFSAFDKGSLQEVKNLEKEIEARWKEKQKFNLIEMTVKNILDETDRNIFTRTARLIVVRKAYANLTSIPAIDGNVGHKKDLENLLHNALRSQAAKLKALIMSENPSRLDGAQLIEQCQVLTKAAIDGNWGTFDSLLKKGTISQSIYNQVNEIKCNAPDLIKSTGAPVTGKSA